MTQPLPKHLKERMEIEANGLDGCLLCDKVGNEFVGLEGEWFREGFYVCWNEVQELVEALEFYADAENWTLNRQHTERVLEESGAKHAIVGFYTEIWEDAEDTDNFMDCPVGGKRARAALNKFKEGKAGDE